MTFVLDATTRALKMVLEDANGADVQFTATWADSTATGFTKGSSQGVSNGTSAVDVVAAPAASTRRVVKSITFHNTQNFNTIRFFYDDNGTQRTIAKFALNPGDSWYSDTASKEEKLTGVLDATNRTIKFVLDGAGTDVEFTAAWADSTATTFTQGSSRGASNGTSAVDIVAAPAANTRRVVKAISFYNAHASSTRTVTLYYDVAGTTRNIAKFTLAAGESWFSDTPSFGIQPQGYVYAAPAVGAGPPSFRALGLGDVVSGSTGSGDVVLQTSPTIITPRIAAIHTTSSPFRAVLSTVQVASSANYLQLSNAATGAGLGPILETIGTGSDVSFFLKSKGTGNVIAETAGFTVKPLVSTNPGYLTILGATGASGGGILAIRSNNANDIIFQTPDSLAATVSYTLPGADGTSGQVLSTNGSGVLSWATASGGGVSDGDKGDITVSASGATWTIDNAVVTLAKMADLVTDRLIGRDSSGTGAPESLTVGGGIEFTGSGGIQTSAFTGDVTKTAGGTSTTIANGAVTLAKMATMATDSILGRATASTGNVEVLTALPFAYTGDVTRPADSNVTTIANDAVTTAKIINDAVTFAKVQNISSSRILGRTTSSSGDIEELTVGTGLTLASQVLGLAGAAAQSLSPTTANVTATLNAFHIIDLSGLTANRSVELPTGAAGNVINLLIGTGNASFELIVKGASTVTINGGAAATEWSRLFIKGEFVQFTASSSTNWNVTIDGRISCQGIGVDDGERLGSGGSDLTVSAVNLTTDVITTSANHGLSNFDPIFFKTTMPATGGISSFNDISNIYWVFDETANTFKIASSRAGAVASTAVNMTGTAQTGGLVRRGVAYNYNTFQKILLRTATLNVGNVIDSTNNALKIRRTGVYQLSFSAVFSEFVAIGFQFQTVLSTTDASGTNSAPIPILSLANLFGSGRVNATMSALLQLSAGDLVYALPRHLAESSTNQIYQSNDYRLFNPFSSLLEVL